MVDNAPPPTSRPAGRLSDLSKQPSFFGRWLAGAQGPQDQQIQEQKQQQRGKRPSLLGFLFDNGDNDGASKANAEKTGSSSREKEKLVQKLTRQLEDSGIESFTLTPKELRLLLDLPEKKSLAFVTSGSDGVPCPPPVEPLPVQSSLFDSWDFTSTDDLSGDEIQAIMIALAADQQTAPASTMISDGSNKSGEDEMLAPPALISKNARQVSIQKIDSMEGPQYLVTLGNSNGGEVPPLPPSLLSTAGFSLTTHSEEEEALRSSSTSSVSMKPSGLTRQFSIQPFPTGESAGVTTAAEKPNAVGTRQVSVQALPKGSACTDSQEEIAAAHYIVSLPELKAATERGKRNAVPDKIPSPPTRKVSVQPALLDFFENKDGPPSHLKRCPTNSSTLDGFRSVSVCMNGGKSFENFQMGPL